MISVCRPPVELGYFRKISSIAFDLSAYSIYLPNCLRISDAHRYSRTFFVVLSTCSMIGWCGSWYDTVVRPSVYPPICDAEHCGAHGRCNGWKLYCRVPRTALPFRFFRHFCCRMHRLATFAVSLSHSKHTTRNGTAEISASIMAMGRVHGHVTVTMAVPDTAFSAIRFCSHIVRFVLQLRSASSISQ